MKYHNNYIMYLLLLYSNYTICKVNNYIDL